MSRWLTPLGANDDLEYEATYEENLKDATDFITLVMAVKQYPPFTPYRVGRDFRHKATTSKEQGQHVNK